MRMDAKKLSIECYYIASFGLIDVSGAIVLASGSPLPLTTLPILSVAGALHDPSREIVKCDFSADVAIMSKRCDSLRIPQDAHASPNPRTDEGFDGIGPIRWRHQDSESALTEITELR